MIIRVTDMTCISTKDQCLDLQIDALKKFGCEKIIQEIANPNIS